METTNLDTGHRIDTEIAPGWRRITTYRGNTLPLRGRALYMKNGDFVCLSAQRWSGPQPFLYPIVRWKHRVRMVRLAEFETKTLSHHVRLSDIDRLRWSETVLGLPTFTSICPSELLKHWFLVHTSPLNEELSLAHDFGVQLAIHRRGLPLGPVVFIHQDPIVVHELALAANVRIQHIYRPGP
jgi:hypothetical protein